jgi:hypothetical protein
VFKDNTWGASYNSIGQKVKFVFGLNGNPLNIKLSSSPTPLFLPFSRNHFYVSPEGLKFTTPLRRFKYDFG